MADVPGNYNRKYMKDFHPKDFIRLSKMGLDGGHICRTWGIAYNTMSFWSKRHPEFKEALYLGRQHFKEVTSKQYLN